MNVQGTGIPLSHGSFQMNNRHLRFPWSRCCIGLMASILMSRGRVTLADDVPPARTYSNELRRLDSPSPLLADYPDYVAPVTDLTQVRSTDSCR